LRVDRDDFHTSALEQTDQLHIGTTVKAYAHAGIDLPGSDLMTQWKKESSAFLDSATAAYSKSIRHCLDREKVSEKGCKRALSDKSLGIQPIPDPLRHHFRIIERVSMPDPVLVLSPSAAPNRIRLAAAARN
jgi:hypothetical protein